MVGRPTREVGMIVATRPRPPGKIDRDPHVPPGDRGRQRSKPREEGAAPMGRGPLRESARLDRSVSGLGTPGRAAGLLTPATAREYCPISIHCRPQSYARLRPAGPRMARGLGHPTGDHGVTRIWYQVLSSRTKTPEMFDVLQHYLDELKNPETELDIRGTAIGGFADQYSAFVDLDAARVIELATKSFTGPNQPAVYAMANSLDPSVLGLRELLDVPVLTLMEVACNLAPSFGDRYGVLVPNRRFSYLYRDLIEGYGSTKKLAGIDQLPYDRILDMRKIFAREPGAAEACLSAVTEGFERLRERGAEVVIVPGPVGMFLGAEKVSELAGVRYLDAFALLLKMAEGIVAIPGLTTSRAFRYLRPPASLLKEAYEEYGLGAD